MISPSVTFRFWGLRGDISLRYSVALIVLISFWKSWTNKPWEW